MRQDAITTLASAHMALAPERSEQPDSVHLLLKLLRSKFVFGRLVSVCLFWLVWK